MQVEYSVKMDADEEQKGAEMRKVKDRQVIADSAGVCRDGKQGWATPRCSSAGRAMLTTR